MLWNIRKRKRLRLGLLSTTVLLCLISTFALTANGEEQKPAYNVRDEGAVGDGSVDDTSPIQQAFDKAAATGGTVYFPNGRYLVKTVQVRGDNIKVVGEDAVLVSNHEKYEVKYDADTVRERSILNTDLAKQTIFSGIPYEQDILEGQSFLQLPSALDISNLRHNDMVMVTTVKGDPWAPSYKYGSLRYITSIDGTNRTVTLDSGIETALKARKGKQANDDVKLFVYRPLQNFHMEGLTFELKEDGRQNGVFIDFVKDAVIKDVRFIGKGQNLTGLSIAGFNMDISHIHAEGFLSNELGIGYGVNIAGNHVKVHHSTFINTKHAISAADRRYRNNDFEYSYNQVSDPQSAALEAHGTGEHISIHDNIITDVGRSFIGCGIWARGKHYEIYNNIIRGADERIAGSTCGIKLIESAVQDITVTNNQVLRVAYGLMTDLWTAAERDIKIANNSFTTVDTGVLVKQLNRSQIEQNIIEAQYNGIIAFGGNDLSVAHNQIRYDKDFGIILQEDAKLPNVTKGITIHNNIITPGKSANNPIRIQNSYDYVTITENKFNTFMNGSTTLKIHTQQAKNLSHRIIQNNRNVADSEPGK